MLMNIPINDESGKGRSKAFHYAEKNASLEAILGFFAILLGEFRHLSQHHHFAL